MPVRLRGAAAQARGRRGPEPASRAAPRPELLPGMGPLPVGGPLRVAQARSSSGVSTTMIPAGHVRAIGRGRPLDPAIRGGMERFFGVDFSTVRVFEGPAAPAMGALAFTVGEQLHFAPGLYDPASHAGVELLGHELAHVVQQRAGRVANPYGRMIAIVQDPVLEAEADRAGKEVAARVAPVRAPRLPAPMSKAPPRGARTAARPGATVQRSLQSGLFAPRFTLYSSEDFLIARLRGLDGQLKLRNGVANDLILAELEALTDQISDKAWLKATAVMLAVRARWKIDQFPPPLIPIDSPDLVEGEVVLEHGDVIFLPARPKGIVKTGPGTELIELGAGPMDSARSLWLKRTLTAFTEFRSKLDLQSYYQQKFLQNLIEIAEIDPQNEQHNIIEYGIDATQVGPFHNLPLTKILLFTNPNIGHQDIDKDIRGPITEAASDESAENISYSSMGLHFVLSVDRLRHYRSFKNGQGKWLETVITSTTNSISTCRNISLLHRFMLNAPSKLIPGQGVVQIIVSTSYLDRWPLVEMATDMGYTVHIQKDIELEFENVKTQESENVSEKPPEKTLITLVPPWGRYLKVFNVIAYCGKPTKYTDRQPTLLSIVFDW